MRQVSPITRGWKRARRLCVAGAVSLLALASLLTVAGCGGGDATQEGARSSERGGTLPEQWENPGGRWHPLRQSPVSEEQVEEAVRALHDVFGLADDQIVHETTHRGARDE